MNKIAIKYKISFTKKFLLLLKLIMLPNTYGSVSQKKTYEIILSYLRKYIKVYSVSLSWERYLLSSTSVSVYQEMYLLSSTSGLC